MHTISSESTLYIFSILTQEVVRRDQGSQLKLSGLSVAAFQMGPALVMSVNRAGLM